MSQKVQSRSERVRDSSHCLRESKDPVRSDGVRGSSQGLRESEGPVRV